MTNATYLQRSNNPSLFRCRCLTVGSTLAEGGKVHSGPSKWRSSSKVSLVFSSLFCVVFSITVSADEAKDQEERLNMGKDKQTHDLLCKLHPTGVERYLLCIQATIGSNASLMVDPDKAGLPKSQEEDGRTEQESRERSPNGSAYIYITSYPLRFLSWSLQ